MNQWMRYIKVRPFVFDTSFYQVVEILKVKYRYTIKNKKYTEITCQYPISSTTEGEMRLRSM